RGRSWLGSARLERERKDEARVWLRHRAFEPQVHCGGELLIFERFSRAHPRLGIEKFIRPAIPSRSGSLLPELEDLGRELAIQHQPRQPHQRTCEIRSRDSK